MTIQADIERLREALDRRERALTRIRDWCSAYPVTVFRDMDEGDYARAHDALLAIGLSSDRLHAAWARHILAGLTRIIDEGMTDVRSYDEAARLTG